MKRNTVRISESQLRKLISESVKRALRESEEASESRTKEGFDRLVMSCSGPYQKYIDIVNRAEDMAYKIEDPRNPDDPTARRVLKLIEREKEILDNIAEKINNVFGFERVFVEFENENPYSEAFGFYLLSSGEDSEDYYFTRTLKEALRSGKPFSQVDGEEEERARKSEADFKRREEEGFNKQMKNIHGEKWHPGKDEKSPFKSFGKIDLSSKDLNKKRW